VPPEGGVDSKDSKPVASGAVPTGSARDEIRTVSAAELLGRAGVVRIEHEGELYTLRRTRLGRLILTK
jgi:hemin uptake protein HemP